jgi:glycosyltransferase involved in cell wall biosynthesis
VLITEPTELGKRFGRVKLVKVTIGLCVRNSEKEVSIALNSIFNQDYPHRLMKLIVVDDGCTDNTIPIVRTFISKKDIETTILVSGGKGLGYSRQMVVDNAEGDYIVWVDDDFSLQKTFVSRQIEFMERNSTVGAACPRPIVKTKTTFTSVGNTGFLIQPQNPTSIGTGGAIFRIKAIKAVGGFDLEIKGAGEDKDISYRIFKAGWLLARNNSATLSREFPPVSLVSLWRKHVWYGRANHFIYHKNVDKKLLFSNYFPFAFLGGVTDALRIYSINREKITFILPLYNGFIHTAELFGFIRAHFDEYGHFRRGNVTD